jgi:hypothetical protein
MLTPNEDFTNWFWHETTDERNQREFRLLRYLVEFRKYGFLAWYKPGLRDQLIIEEIDRQCGPIRFAA